VTGEDFYREARAATDSGDYDGAMVLLRQADMAADLDPKLTTNMRHEIAALVAAKETAAAEAVAAEPVKLAAEEGPEIVSVADQKAAGIHPDDTVTMADQRAGTPLAEPRPEGSEETSVGTSSLTSDDKQDKSGSSVQETESSSPSPAPTVESPSSPDLPQQPAPFSTAPSTSGSTQETGLSQQSPSDSSEGSTEPTSTTPADTTEATADDTASAAHEMISLARAQFDAENYDGAEEFLAKADALDPSVAPETAMARQAIAAARDKPSFPA
jgi:hypothetical protein